MDDRGVVTWWQYCDNRRLPWVSWSMAAVPDPFHLIVHNNAVDYQRCDYVRAVGKAELDNRAAYQSETDGVRDGVAVLQSEYPTADLGQRTAMAVIRDEVGKRGVDVVCAHCQVICS